MGSDTHAGGGRGDEVGYNAGMKPGTHAGGGQGWVRNFPPQWVVGRGWESKFYAGATAGVEVPSSASAPPNYHP